MLRFFYVIIRNILRAIILIPAMDYVGAHPEKFSVEKRYRVVQRVAGYIRKTGRIRTQCDGLENLPKEGGYIMFPNHQGKYDAIGILYSHKEPCSFVLDARKADGIFLKQVLSMVGGMGLETDNVRQSMGVILEVARRVKEGERFFIFPEGGYTDNHNQLQHFKPGAFKSALKSRCPIVPVALIDSYKPFEGWSLKAVTTKVIYLSPILYEEYKNRNTIEIAEMVKEKIKETIEKFA